MADAPEDKPLEALAARAGRALPALSHELRTPLTAVIGYADMLLEGLLGPVSAEQREAVATILERSEALLGTLNALLDLAAFAGGNVPLLRVPFDVGELVAEAIAAAAAEAKRAKVTVEAVVEGGLPPLVADRERLAASLRQLLRNALAFSPAGGTVRVEAAKRLETGRFWIELVVADEGPGLPRDVHSRIFEPFFQAEGSASRGQPGAGLGLALVRAHALAHGGRAWVESAPGAGSRFAMLLPLG
ncbi:MAG TPA: HAMP domain-containing sensor histidine kinase [Myxococcales bacterium]|nr:HAMP domain-containing sensor histidine kinase [Myxococcales bacterium]